MTAARRPRSPYRLTYSARIKSASIMHNQVSFSSRACSLTSSNYHSDLAVEAERDARRIIEKSSVFENWWDQDEDVQGYNGIQYKNTNTKKLKGRFFTHPQYHGSTKRGSKYLDDENASLAACGVNNSNGSLGSVTTYQDQDVQGYNGIQYKTTNTKKLKGNASLAACKVNNHNESLGSIGKTHDATRVEHVLSSDIKGDFDI